MPLWFFFFCACSERGFGCTSLTRSTGRDFGIAWSRTQAQRAGAGKDTDKVDPESAVVWVGSNSVYRKLVDA